MIPAQLDGWLWLLATLIPLLFLQRSLHYQIQAVLLLLTRRIEVTAVLFSIIFFPGVLLHEASHFLMAKLVRVRTGKFSLLPTQLPGGKLRLGYVETAVSDPVRETLIGVAPLITGSLFVSYIVFQHLGLLAAWNTAKSGGPDMIFSLLGELIRRPDFWLWFYLLFTVSSMMLPSSSDRRTWLPIAAWLIFLLGISLLAGVGPWLLENIAPTIDRGVTALAVVFGISAVIHLVLLPVFWGIQRLLSHFTRMEVR
jgi:hypothetical protein